MAKKMTLESWLVRQRREHPYENARQALRRLVHARCGWWIDQGTLSRWLSDDPEQRRTPGDKARERLDRALGVRLVWREAQRG